MPRQVDIEIDSLTSNWFKSSIFVNYNLQPINLVEKRIKNGPERKIGDIDFSKSSDINLINFDGYYLITANGKRTIVRDKTKYHLEQSDLISGKRINITPAEFKTFFYELKSKQKATKYSALTNQKQPITTN